MSQGTEDKLAIYKSQANAASKKKEKMLEELKQQEEEERGLELALEHKEKEYAQLKGTKFMKHDDFKQYAASLRGKQTQYKRMCNVINEIKAELTVLLTTEKILKNRSEEVIIKLKENEAKTGAFGYYVGRARTILRRISAKKWLKFPTGKRRSTRRRR